MFIKRQQVCQMISSATENYEKFLHFKKFFNSPAELVNQSNLFSCKVKTIGCNPILFALYDITDKS